MQAALLQRATALAVIGSMLVGCSVPVMTPLDQNETLVSGPQIEDVVTPFDTALACLNGRINREALRFSVGAILDTTGKEQLSESGTGKFVTQGAGDIVQSALFQAGVSLVNRRDPRIVDAEAKWGIRDTKTQLASTFFITGSINSLDFLPGSGLDIQIAGIGPRSRQHRILVGLDLSLTETRTGRVLANVPLQKQIVASDEGFGVGRFFGTTLVSLDMGNRNREALHFVMRQMLNLATFEMLTQLMKPEQYIDCWEMVEKAKGVLGNTRASQKIEAYRASLAKGKPSPTENGFSALSQADSSKKTEASTTQDKPTTPARARPALDAPPAGGANPAGAYFQEEQATATADTLRALELRRASPPTDADRATGSDEVSEGTTAPAAISADMAPGQPPAAGTSSPTVPALRATVSNAAANDSKCAFANTLDFPKVTPLLATSSGEQLRIRSANDTNLCVADRNGVFKTYEIKAQTEQLLKGQAPWRLQGNNLRLLEIVYQGNKLRLPGYVSNQAELLEKSGF